ncbi:Os04g0469425 [Oryza sativa Japonica Group]|uniref:Os04g0469425 protein n=1 Tax=Oryza sativa subsp. japonica TaxID=39947 RepID=A0A0P0WBF6_ORYSJ|nr:hypothetical protein EE612_023851 [Oryza sativa]BAS89628.1 Os04g0469425 [Oryza sativa Japonica Group]
MSAFHEKTVRAGIPSNRRWASGRRPHLPYMNSSLVARNPASSSPRAPVATACACNCLPSETALLTATRSRTQP